jgi:hypothetical protein
MSKKALLVGLKYPYDPDFFQDPDSVNDILSSIDVYLSN